MDEQEMDVIERARLIDVDGPEAQPYAHPPGNTGEGTRQSAQAERERGWRERAEQVRARSAAFERQVSDAPLRIVNGVMGTLPVQTREHLRQSAREGVLAVSSFVEAISAAALTAVDRLTADPRSEQEKAQPRRIVIEREDDTPNNPPVR